MSRPRQVSDEEILRVARECLIARGPTISTSEIARQSGVSQAVIFQRFGTKDHLVRAALDSPGAPDWLELARRGPDQRPGREQLLELAVAIHGFFDEMVPRWEALRGCGVQPDWNEDDSPPLRFHRTLSGWFTRARTRGLLVDHDARGAALGFLGALQVRPWFQHVAQQAPGRGARAYVETVVDLFWAALRPGARASAAPPRGRRSAKTTTRRHTG
ncbi:MAG TPA: TetR/AcrR family transcriptional regulator [Kofleriaceae bacterium]|nr:TetR/AcrR family transcriptional regulator [Kofleriaceae bacterium]